MTGFDPKSARSGKLCTFYNEKGLIYIYLPDNFRCRPIPLLRLDLNSLTPTVDLS